MKNVLRFLLLRFYCLDMTDAALLILGLTVLFLLMHQWLSEKRWWKGLIGAALISLLCVITYSTIFARDGGALLQHNFVPFHSYREVQNGGNPEIYRSNFMNVILFYPAGLLAMVLLPRRWPGWSRCLLVVLALTAISVGIEFLQYRYALGRCEMDDVIHNAFGACLGCFAVLLSKLWDFLNEKLLRRSENRV